MRQALPDDSNLPPRGGAVAVAMPRRLSQIFRELAARPQDTISIREIRGALGDRSFATLLVLLSTINLIPFPPGTTLILGIPIILLAGQMALGYKTPWLPGRVLDRPITTERFRNIVSRLVPRLEQLESVIRPRYWFFSQDRADRFVGSVALLLGIVVFLPIPFGNWPPSIAIILMSLAHSERDGLVLAIGVAIGIAAIALISFVVGAAGIMAASMLGIG